MNSANNIQPEPGENSFTHLFKTQRTTVSVFLFLVLVIVFLGFWQIKTHVLKPFRAPEDSSGLVASNSNILDESLDTDGDGLSDYDEKFLYGTSPFLEDTDSDGISDYDEIIQGSDPKCAAGSDCMLDNNYYESINNNASTTIAIGAEGGLGEISLPSDVNTADLEQALAGSITVPELRALLLQSGADAETLEQISDEELLASYQEVLNNSNEQ